MNPTQRGSDIAAVAGWGFAIQINGQTMAGRAAGSDCGKARDMDVDGLRLGIRRGCERNARGRYERCWLELHNRGRAPAHVGRIWLIAHPLPRGAAAKWLRSEIGVRACFVKHARAMLALVPEFPAFDGEVRGGAIRLGYQAECDVAPGAVYRSEAVLAAACDPDESFSAALGRLITARFPLPQDGPIHVYYGLTNQWYGEGFSAFRGDPGYPTVALDPDGVCRQLRHARSLGFTHYVVYPFLDHWYHGFPSPAAVRKVVQCGHRLGLQLLASSTLHYNAYHGFSPIYGDAARRQIAGYKAEWAVRDENGVALGHEHRRYQPCPVVRDFMARIDATVVRPIRDFGFDGVLIDARPLTPCFAPDHGHAPGRASLYAQARAVADFFERIRALRPGMTIACNLGFIPLLPQFARYLDSIYLTDPHGGMALPGLSHLKVLDDSRRAQALEMVEDLGIPADRNQNCEYYLLPNAPLTDEKVFEYGVLQGLAVGPNLTAGDLDSFLATAPGRSARRIDAFWRAWLAWATRHHAILRKPPRRLSPRPGLGKLEVYARAGKDRTFLFAINPSPFPRQTKVRLRELERVGTLSVVNELYPVRQRRAGDRGALFDHSQSLMLEVSAGSILILEIAPATNVRQPVLAGLPGSIKPRNGGYRVTVEGSTGASGAVALDLPGQRVAAVSAVLDPRTRPDPAGQAVQIGASNRCRIQFPGQPFTAFLGQWRAAAATAREGLRRGWLKHGVPGKPAAFPTAGFERAVRQARSPVSLAPADRFLGVQLLNLPPCPEHLTLDVKTVPGKATWPLASAGAAPQPTAALAAGPRAWWMEANLSLPFAGSAAQWIPADQYLLLFGFAAPQAIAELRVWINQAPMTVNRFNFIRCSTPENFAYYVNAHSDPGPLREGKNTLTICVRWK